MADVYMPKFCIGEELTYVAAWSVNRTVQGNWVRAGATAQLTGTLERITLEEPGLQHQDIRPVNRKIVNNVIVGDGFGWTYVEIQKSDTNFNPMLITGGQGGNVLPQLVALGNYGETVFVRGFEFFDVWGIRGAYRDGITDYGKNTIELPYLPIDLGLPHNIIYGLVGN